LELYQKQTFKTCQFNEMNICWLNLHITIQKKAPESAHFVDNALKTSGIKYI